MSYQFLISSFLFLFFAQSFAYAAIPVEQANVQKISNPTHKPHHFLKKIADELKPIKNPNRNGLLSLLFGIGGIFIFPLLSIPAIVLGIISLTKKEPSQSMAIIGLVTGGLVFLLYSAILIFLFIVSV